MAAERKTAAAEGEELVSVQLFKDGGKYKDDVYVSVTNRDGGENCLIQRGKVVQVKAKFAKALELSMEQDASTADFITRKSDEFERATKALN